MEHLDQILLLLLFVVLPIAQRVVGWLAQKRRAAVARAEERRASLDVSSPPRVDPETRLETHEVEDAEQRGEVLWKRMLEAIGAQEEPEPLREPAPLEYDVPAPARDVVAPAQPVHAAPVHLGEALPTFQVAPLGTIGPAVSEDEIEAGRIERFSLVEISPFDSTERSEELGALPGFAPSAADAEVAAGQALARARRGSSAAAGADWRRAIVLAEILAPPLALRAPDAPGTTPSR